MRNKCEELGQRIAGLFMLGHAGSNLRERNLYTRLNNCERKLVHGIDKENSDLVEEARNGYSDLLVQLRYHVEAIQGDVENDPAPVNWHNLTVEQIREKKKQYGTKDNKTWVNNACRTSECDGLILMYIVGSELARVADRKLSDQDLFPKCGMPVIENVHNNESYENLFRESNDFGSIKSALCGRFTTLASRNNLVQGLDVLNYINENYRRK
jgi:hypothetical protein